MKRLFSILMILSLLLFSFIACANDTDGPSDDNGGTSDNGNGGNVPEEPGSPDSPQTPDKPVDSNGINLGKADTVIYCDPENDALKTSLDNLIYRIYNECGKRPTVTSDASSSDVIISIDASDERANDVVGCYSIAYEEGKLHICASDVEALNCAKDKILSEYAWSGGVTVPSDISVSQLFNKYDYREGKMTVYTDAEAEALPLLTAISVDGTPIPSFNPMLKFYTLISSKDTYPTVTATALSKNATVSTEAPTEENAGIATINVTVGDAMESYTVIFCENISAADSEIVIKNGAEGTISFVIDDGGVETATFMVENILGKEGYENITASFALITNKVANLVQGVDSEGRPIWLTDENGRYIYDEVDGMFSFWREVLATGKAEVVSHTHTHTYPGANDAGGIFYFKKNDGTYSQTEYLPINNIVMEHYAARQIVEDISGEEAYCLVIPGVGAPTPAYVSKSILKNGYLLARGTFGAGNANVGKDFAKYIFFPEDLLSEDRLRSVQAYMIEHYASSGTFITDENSSNSDCLAAGIDNWTDYMDLALELGGWASFCLHEIRSDGYTGGGHHIYQSQAKELFGYANDYGDRAWIAPYEDAARYYLAWAYSTTKASIIDGRIITVSLENSSDDERINVPLTVKVKLPASWTGVTLDGEALEVRYDDQGTAYVLVDLSDGESVELVSTGYNASVSEEPVA